MASACQPIVEQVGHKSNFICGVVEGFYGRPWTTEQRKDLFQKMKKWGMDSYVYAPKDDYKHRAYWRELYTVEEAEHLTGLISGAKAQGITFYYALSPGLDITYSNQKEVTALKRKLEQVSQFGCTAFALLFDDIEPEMSEADKDIFQSFAHAQVSITNEIQQHLGGAAIQFLLCPTQYCGTRALPTVSSSEYLSTLGAKLSSNIDIMWTGPKVISKTLTPSCIEEITRVLKRPPVIWDNLHANDYDQKRMFLGPYSGRSPELIPLLRGVLSNPNCEYNANTVPIRTLAHWANCSIDASSNCSAEVKLEQEDDNNEFDTEGSISVNKHVYHQRQALRNAVTEWLPEFSIPKDAFGPIVKPQPTVNVATVPILPIMPSVNTCMSLTTTTSTSSNCSRGPTTTNCIPTVNTSQLQTLADVCTTVSSIENFNPISNPIMNSLVSATKVITNDSIPNPIPPLVTSNINFPAEIPVSTIPIPIMGMKNMEDNKMEDDIAKNCDSDSLRVESDSPMLDVTTESDSITDLSESNLDQSINNSKSDATMEGDIVQNSNDENSLNLAQNMQTDTPTLKNDIDIENNVEIINNDSNHIEKKSLNGMMNVEVKQKSSFDLNPVSLSETAMEYTPEDENTQLINNESENMTELNKLADDENQVIDVVMTDESSENGIMQVEPVINQLSNEMVVETNDSIESSTAPKDDLTVDDLMLLCDLFYLPFEHGSQALKLLQEFNWLKTNAPVLIGYTRNSPNNIKNGIIDKSEHQEWNRHAEKFNGLCDRVSQLARRLARCNNRELLHDICGYLWDLRAVVGLLQSFVKWLALGKFPPNICHYTQGSYTWFSKGWKEAFMSGDQEPWVFRGGLIADLQRLMPIDNGSDLLAYKLPASPTSKLYSIRPYVEVDREKIYSLCYKTSCDGLSCADSFPSDLPSLPGDKLVGAYLTLLPEFCMVIENEDKEIVGFACATMDARAFQRRREREWAPRMRRKYPPKLMNSQSKLHPAAKSFVQSFYQFKYLLPDVVHRFHPAEICCYMLPECDDHSGPKRLITCLLAALRSNGSFGVHICINATDHYFNQYFTKLGFVEISQDISNNNIYLGRTF